MKTAVVYARVSTADQVKGTSLDGQVEACEQYAAEHGYKVLKTFREDISGARLDRPKLDQVRDMAAGGELEAIIVLEVDRLSRVLTHQMLLIEEFQRARVDILFVNSPREDTPEGRMLFGMKGLFAEYERAKIQERTRRGKERRAKEGKVMGSWAVPYGYRFIPGDGRYEVIEAEAQVVIRIFDWIVKEHCTLGEVSRRLDLMGAPTKRGAGYWHRSTVRSIVANAVYAGEWYWNKTKSVEPRRRRTEEAPKKLKCSQVARPQEEWIPVGSPAIISKELYEAAQKQLDRNKEISARNCKTEYLLRGLLFCPYCNRRLVGRRVDNGKCNQYCCTGKTVPGLRENCKTPYLNGKNIERLVWDHLMALFSDPKTIIDTLATRDQARQQERLRDDAQLEVLQDGLQALKRERDKLLDLHLADLVDRETLQERLAVLNKKQEIVEAGKAELLERMKDRDLTIANKQAIERLCNMAREGLELLTFQDKREFLEALEIRGLVEDGRIVLSGLIKDTVLTFAHSSGNSGKADILRTQYQDAVKGVGEAGAEAAEYAEPVHL